MDIKRIAASADAIAVFRKGTVIVGAYLVGGSGDSSALLFDKAAASGGTDFLSLKALTNTQSPQVTLPGGGKRLNIGLSVTLAGTGAVLYVMVE